MKFSTSKSATFTKRQNVIGHFKRRQQVKNIIFILTIFPTVLFGQTATFSTDTTRFLDETRKDIFDKIKEAEWRINGQTLHYGSKPITIKTDNILDTILYRQQNNSKVDTIVCNINRAGNFKFYYNECCGGFNIANETGKFIIGTIIFSIQGQTNKKKYLGTLGETGILVNSSSKDTLETGCRSAMSPNVYQITFSQIEICTDTVNCKEGTCLFEKGKEGLNYEFGFKTISKKIDCLFLPLSNQPIKVNYDPKTDRIRIE